MGECRLRCPGSILAVGDLGLASVDLDWRLLDVAAAKDTRLEVLVLKRFAVEANCLQRGVSFNGPSVRVDPVDIGSHEGSISPVVVEDLCSGAVEFLSHKVVP